MPKLENPLESPCFGCGPRHPRGLRLSFERHGNQVVCIHTPRKDEVGWPGYMHPGLHFMVLRETSYWGALSLGGKIHGAGTRSVLRFFTSPPVGVPFRARSKIVKRTRRGVHILAVSESLKEHLYGTLQTFYTPVRRSHIKKAGLKLPTYLLEDMDP
jgi:hypothetical protein